MQLLNKGRHENKGQSPVEVIGIAIVLVGLLLLVLVTTYTRNAETSQLLSISENSQQCSKVSASIARLYSNRANTDLNLYLAVETTLERIEGNTGGIKVGGVSCSYIGGVEYDDCGAPIYDTDSDGISLSVGNWCFGKQDSKIVIRSEEPCD